MSIKDTIRAMPKDIVLTYEYTKPLMPSDMPVNHTKLGKSIDLQALVDSHDELLLLADALARCAYGDKISFGEHSDPNVGYTLGFIVESGGNATGTYTVLNKTKVLKAIAEAEKL